MGIVRLLVCLGYCAFLTVLLLVPDPAAVVGLHKVPAFPWGELGIHFTGFTVLAFLAHASRFPKGPHWLIICLLLAYGLTTESLQSFVPHRSVELLDYLENILGILAGSGIYWLAIRLLPKIDRAAILPRGESAVEAGDGRGEDRVADGLGPRTSAESA